MSRRAPVLTLVRVPRLPRWPSWAVAVTGLWLGLVALTRVVAPDAVLCTFRRVTGEPCPGCGTTRGVAALAKGEIGPAFAHNPLVLATLVLVVGLLVLRLVAGVAPRLRIGRAALLLTAVLVVANWAYVIHVDRPPGPIGPPPAPAGAQEGDASAPAAPQGPLPLGDGIDRQAG